MAEGKKSFILYADIIHLVSELPREIKGDLFQLILDYVNDKNPDPTDLLLKVAFEPIKRQLKRDLERWDKFREKQANNGRLGGRPKKDNPLTENPNNPSLLEESQKSLNVTVNGTVNGTVTEEESTRPSDSPAIAGKAEPVTELKSDYSAITPKDLSKITKFIKEHNPSFCDPYTDLWNKFAEKYKVAKIKTMTTGRVKKLQTRLREPEFDFIAILASVSKQEFALQSSWFTFDFIIENSLNYVKILEGKYVAKDKPQSEQVLSKVKYDN